MIELAAEWYDGWCGRRERRKTLTAPVNGRTMNKPGRG